MRPSYEGKELPLVFGDGPWLVVGGYLRRRPDRATENRLRAAFAELDHELAAILASRPAAEPAGRPAR